LVAEEVALQTEPHQRLEQAVLVVLQAVVVAEGLILVEAPLKKVAQAVLVVQVVVVFILGDQHEIRNH
jgi:hypothetical protein